MKTAKIKLSSMQDAKELVKVANKCDFDIDIYYRHIMLDAKSIMGVLSIELNKILTISYNGENIYLEKFLDEHSVLKNIA